MQQCVRFNAKKFFQDFMLGSSWNGPNMVSKLTMQWSLRVLSGGEHYVRAIPNLIFNRTTFDDCCPVNLVSGSCFHFPFFMCS